MERVARDEIPCSDVVKRVPRNQIPSGDIVKRVLFDDKDSQK